MAKKSKTVQKEKLMYAYIALFVMAAIYVGMLFYNSVVYEKKIYPGIKVAGIDVGGKTKDEARGLIDKKIKEAGSPDIILKGTGEYRLKQKDLAVSYNTQKTVEDAFNIGRDDDLKLKKYYQQDIPVVVEVNHDALAKSFFAITRGENESVENATVSLKNGKLVTGKESLGKRVLLGENIETLLSGVGNFQYTFDLKTKTIEPDVRESDIKAAEKEVQELSSKEVTLKDGATAYRLADKDIASFLSFERGESSPSLVYSFDLPYLFPKPTIEGNVIIVFDKTNIRNWVAGFSQKIDSEPKNAKLAGSGGSVAVVASSKDGKKVQLDELAGKLKDALDSGKNEVNIPVQVTKAEVRDDNLAALGLKGLVSTGWTDFSGSPANRRVNISVGASKFNGVLIKPGERFSFNDTLGPVEAYTGYLPELVILKDKTVPQYGGGLCQVSSTAFRAALNAGLPILARSAHAYPVGYYKPFGVDATIYLPSPDLVFQNDTPGYILIQTRSIGNKLYFDFYGTKKDGSIKFAGDAAGTVGVSDLVEGITPTITEKEARGEGSFTATFYRLMYDSAGKLVKTNYWISRYDSPKKYPH
ncbi:MAG: VanW family protein [bacterium]|nr:VanW family protein [bacterium]